jgi:hypothetical protein
VRCWFHSPGTALTLTRKDLEKHAPAGKCDKMLSEAIEGEVSLLESTEARRHLRTRLS